MVNAAVRERLLRLDLELVVNDLSSPTSRRTFWGRVGRLPKVVLALLKIAFLRGARNAAMYLSVSGGYGQLYDILFAALGRALGMRLFLHHHNITYLNERRHLTGLLTRISTTGVHIALSKGMAERMQRLYPAIRSARTVSNAPLFVSAAATIPERINRVRTLGLISNLSAEKGVFVFLDLLEACVREKLPLAGLLAGPFQDAGTERTVQERLRAIPTVNYVGPRYGTDKDAYYASIDVLVFPTQFDTEPLVIHEAMSHGLPVIAYGHGCIPEMVDETSGIIVAPSAAFVPAALSALRTWLANPELVSALSEGARRRYQTMATVNADHWEKLIAEITGSPP